MNITTSHRIEDSKNDRNDARLIIRVDVDGEDHEYVLLSGPRHDVVDFVEGRADMTEIRRRWFAPARC